MLTNGTHLKKMYGFHDNESRNLLSIGENTCFFLKRQTQSTCFRLCNINNGFLEKIFCLYLHNIDFVIVLESAVTQLMKLPNFQSFVYNYSLWVELLRFCTHICKFLNELGYCYPSELTDRRTDFTTGVALETMMITAEPTGSWGKISLLMEFNGLQNDGCHRPWIYSLLHYCHIITMQSRVQSLTIVSGLLLMLNQPVPKWLKTFNKQWALVGKCDTIIVFRPSDAYLRQWTNYHWFR